MATDYKVHPKTSKVNLALSKRLNAPLCFPQNKRIHASFKRFTVTWTLLCTFFLVSQCSIFLEDSKWRKINGKYYYLVEWMTSHYRAKWKDGEEKMHTNRSQHQRNNCYLSNKMLPCQTRVISRWWSWIENSFSSSYSSDWPSLFTSLVYRINNNIMHQNASYYYSYKASWYISKQTKETPWIFLILSCSPRQQQHCLFFLSSINISVYHEIYNYNQNHIEYKYICIRSTTIITRRPKQQAMLLYLCN